MSVIYGTMLDVGHNAVGCWRLRLYVRKKKGRIAGKREVIFVCVCSCVCVCVYVCTCVCVYVRVCYVVAYVTTPPD